ncbi:hypothetical protein PHET_09180 [Paragonimus heterotremus]|uniref:Uncharacterized protein n=1 Tax=Paragonimus heterotremus TaxID=100268 RepID=A0A8J4SHC8_9TREM|nr:hypothetical protein PHET_09180 [Paragonimus heterotremus]
MWTSSDFGFGCNNNHHVVFLLFLIFWGDVLHWLPWKPYRIAGGVHGQLNLWVDQHMVIRILESIPLNKRSPESLRCPRPRPGMQERIPEQLFLVFNGLLLPEVLDKIALSVDKPIPPRIEELRAKWKAGDERVSFTLVPVE